MSSIDEKIQRAQAAQSARPIHKDVTVSLDSALADERTNLMQEVGRLNREREARGEAVKDTLALAPETADLDKRLNSIARKLRHIDRLEHDSLVTIRGYRIPGPQWMDLKAACPPRLNSAIDRGAGYNVNELTTAALAVGGRIVEGDAEIQRTPEEWTVMLELLSGGEFEKVANLIYQVNVSDSQRRTDELKNYSEAALASDKK